MYNATVELTISPGAPAHMVVNHALAKFNINDELYEAKVDAKNSNQAASYELPYAGPPKPIRRPS